MFLNELLRIKAYGREWKGLKIYRTRVRTLWTTPNTDSNHTPTYNQAANQNIQDFCFLYVRAIFFSSRKHPTIYYPGMWITHGNVWIKCTYKPRVNPAVIRLMSFFVFLFTVFRLRSETTEWTKAREFCTSNVVNFVQQNLDYVESLVKRLSIEILMPLDVGFHLRFPFSTFRNYL